MLDQSGTNGYEALQLFHLKFHSIHFLFQTNECRTIPVQGNKTFARYTSNYNWYVINQALILDQKSDINDEFTQDMFISNMKPCDDIRNVVTVEQHSQHDYIANQYKAGNFLNSIAVLWLSQSAPTNVSGRVFCGQSQTNVNSTVLYDDENNDNKFDTPPKYDYCWFNTDSDFGSYQSLISMAYSNCGINKLVYNACKHEEKIFNNSIMSIITNLNCTFNSTCLCVICCKSGHTFDNCEDLQYPVAIWESYIQLCVALHKIKGRAASQDRDMNSLQAYKLSYVNSVDLLPPSSHLDSSAVNRLDKLKGMLAQSIKFVNWTNKKINSLTSQLATENGDDSDNDEGSLSSLNEGTIIDFLRGAQI